ncbi:uncharacterized protein LOC118800810 isoform X2 [Colossoma macropomum]|uniref:uncharacterized protein LOC118800810 isoform X2 n=1 Tax=Colossoma macropomum TaxID=42526 RepID=UPI0018655F4B|nr:uncharacterized protein LOC118800810 isoform X2 [Colossoma macropomum]
MQFCSSALCVLILLTTTFTTVCGAAPTEVKYEKGNLSLIIPVADLSKSGEYTCWCDHKTISAVQLHIDSVPSVKVNLHGNATLPCSVTCSGLFTWVRSNDDVVAQCDQTSCQSVKAGYQMIHDQYLKGDLSLIITDADFSMRDTYACECDGTALRDVEFSINALNSTVQIRSSESLVLDLETPDPVEVNSTGLGSSPSGQICTVDGRSPQCSGDYKHRVSLSPALELNEMKLSDSGVYTRTKKVLHVYTVTVQDDPPSPDKTASVPWLWLSVGLNAVFLVVFVVLGALICRKKSSPCGGGYEMRCVRRNGEDNHSAEEQNILPPDQE